MLQLQDTLGVPGCCYWLMNFHIILRLLLHLPGTAHVMHCFADHVYMYSLQRDFRCTAAHALGTNEADLLMTPHGAVQSRERAIKDHALLLHCRLSDKLWSEALNDINQPEQPRLALKAHDQAFFEDILKDPAALDNAPPMQPTTTQKRIWANLKVGTGMVLRIIVAKMWQGDAVSVCHTSKTGYNPPSWYPPEVCSQFTHKGLDNSCSVSIVKAVS